MQKIRLDDIEKKVDFKVPEKYFEELPMKIQARIAAKEKTQWFPQLNWKLATVFSLVLAVAIGIVFTSTETEASFLADVSDADILLYLESEEWNETDLYASVDDEWDWSSPDEELDAVDFGDGELDMLYDEFDLEGDLNL